MQIAHREHSSRRQHYQQQLRAQRNNNESSDFDTIDGTAHRVASVTLESDSLSADQPMSFRSKRRKKVPRKDKQQEMDVDEQHRQQASGRAGDQQIKADGNEQSTASGKIIPSCKVQMDWEQSGIPSTSATINRSASDLEADVFSEMSESTSNADADDEQSDWPEFGEPKHSTRSARAQQGHLLQPEQNAGDAALSLTVIRQIECFLEDRDQTELMLDQIYRTSAIKQMLRKQPVAVQMVKKGRGTVALKKV